MTISLVQSVGAVVDYSAAPSLAFQSNLSVNSRIVVMAVRWTSPSDPIVLGDISKSAGTATVGSFSQAVTRENGNVSAFIASAAVTGAGSCTIQVAGGAVDSYSLLVILELAGTDLILEGVNSAGGASGAPDSGSVASAGAAAFVGLLSTEGTSQTTHTPDAEFTQIFEEENASVHQTGSAIYRISTGALTDAASWTAPTTLPWSALLAVFKETVSGVTVAPAAVTAKGAVVAPTVVYGSLALSPSAVVAKGAVAAPTVVYGSLVVSPVAAIARGAVVDPTVIGGGVTVEPAAATAKGAAVDPIVVYGSLVIAPAVAVAVGVVVAPTVVIGGGGSVVVSPAAAIARGVVVKPTVIGGGVLNPLGEGDSPGFVVFMLASSIYHSLDDAGLAGGLSEPDESNYAEWATYLFGV